MPSHLILQLVSRVIAAPRASGAVASAVATDRPELSAHYCNVRGAARAPSESLLHAFLRPGQDVTAGSLSRNAFC
jgi:hypothetical protein